MLLPPLRSTLFPYTTLFRSVHHDTGDHFAGAHCMLTGRFGATGAKVLPQVYPSVGDRKSTRLNSSHRCISYAVFCLKKKKRPHERVLTVAIRTRLLDTLYRI